MFDATFESLRNYQCRNMYIQEQEQYEYHVRTYGHPSKFGFKDICGLWKAAAKK